MRARFLCVCLGAFVSLALTLPRAGAKPPDLPVNTKVDCQDAAPAPEPIFIWSFFGDAPPLPMPATAKKMVTKVYPVADLVIPVNCDKKDQVTTTEDRLTKLICTIVAPESWAAKGGKGTMEYHPLTLSIVVHQATDVQDQIADLLASLRKHLDTEVAVEVRFISVCDSMLEKLEAKKLCKDDADIMKKANIVPEGPLPTNTRLLTDLQVSQLMEEIQGGVKSSVLSAPKLSMANGQTGTMFAGQKMEYVTGVLVKAVGDKLVFTPQTEDYTAGVKMGLQPVVSADGRSVRISVNAEVTDLARQKVPLIPIKCGEGDYTQLLQSPKFTRLAVDKEFTVPDGGTAIVSMGKRDHEVGGDGPPVLRAIPYLKRVFNTRHMETEHVLMMVTPRILVSEEEEARQTGTCDKAKTAKTVACPGGTSEEQQTPASCEKASAKCCSACCEKCCAKCCSDCCEKCCAKCCSDCCEKSCPKCCLNRTEPCCTSKDGKAAALVEKYHRACAEGRTDEATRLAVQALAMDPLCFSKKSCPAAGK